MQTIRRVLKSLPQLESRLVVDPASEENASMPDRDSDLRAELLESNEQYRNLFEEHQLNERRLEELNAKSLPSEDDELEEKQIKLHKLSLKDQMEAILREHREAHVTV